MNNNDDFEAEHAEWHITFSDMLTLLLTFFIFIISVSSFEVIKYKQFWKKDQVVDNQNKAATLSNKFVLIKGLKKPVLTPEADNLLTEVESAFTNADHDGVDVYYDENKISLMVSEQLSFAGGEATLKEELKPLLLKLVAPINKSKFDITIDGHTDALTNPGIDNMALSLERALSVARFLIASGVAKQKLTVAGYGSFRPLVENDTPENRLINRRVEISVMIRND